MNIICFDIESTINNKGQPFDLTNKIVSIAWTDGTQNQCVKANDYGRHFIQRAIDKADLLIGFNIKFDINWLRRFGISFDNKRVYDCQLAEYIIRRQRVKYPSLSTTLETYGLEGKLDIVKEDYWKKDIDTDQIPWDILSKYNIQDVEQTLKVYHEQQKITNPIQKRLIQLCCDDLIVLQEMEFNGIPCDLDQCHRESDKIKEEIGKITNELGSRYPQVPLNFNSTDHLSAFLYGGTVHEEGREIAGLYKTGNKTGQPRFKIVRTEHKLDGIVKPIEGSELLKEGMYSTSEDVLRKIKDKTGVITNLLKLASLTKVNEFFEGFIKINREMNWPKNKIHGQFNQVTTWTGRLSSTKPNLQNMCPEIQECVRSEYD